MGLCKCKNVTNLFCFEHRKNVCEKCILSDHERCIVKSYLQWLQDSDFESQCLLCRKSFTAAGNADTAIVRLACLDVFHLQCLNKYCNDMPENTAPAGYSCPACTVPVLPAENAAGLLAQRSRQILLQSPDAGWAKRLAVAPTPSAFMKSTVSVDLDSPDPNSPQKSSAGPLGSQPARSTYSTPTVGSSAVPPPHSQSSLGRSAISIPFPDSVRESGRAGPSRHGHADPDDEKYQRRQSRLVTQYGSLGAAVRFLRLLVSSIQGRVSIRNVLILLLVTMLVVVMWVGSVLRPAPTAQEQILETAKVNLREGVGPAMQPVLKAAKVPFEAN